MGRAKRDLWLYLWGILSLVGCTAVLVFVPRTGGWGVARLITGSLLGLSTAVAAVVGSVRGLARRPRRAGAAFATDAAAAGRMATATRTAIRRYLESVDRSRLVRSGALYERPWVLVLGDSGCGKSALLDRCGVGFPNRYPSERDGLRVSSEETPRFLFGNEAVYVDTPGGFLQGETSQLWDALIVALAQQRPLRPADGAVVVVNVGELVDASPERVKELARRLRGRIDTMIRVWGIEFPVHLVLSHCDTLPGFAEYFKGRIDRWAGDVLGASLYAGEGGVLPRMLFNDEFALLCRALTDHRIDRLVQERDEAAKRAVCRFVIQFEALQDKIGSLVAELFKPSSYEGKPLFSGFFFTAVTTVEEGVVRAQTSAGVSTSTIESHPLNPHRAKGPSRGTAAPRAVATPAQAGIFAPTLFSQVIPAGIGKIQSTSKRVRSRRITFGISLVATLLGAGLLSFWAFSSFARAQRLYTSIEKDFREVFSVSAGIGEWAALELAGRHVQALSQGLPPDQRPGPGFGPSRELQREAGRAYGTILERQIARPAFLWLERETGAKIRTYSHSNARDYQELYRLLKAYLSMSELVAQQRDLIDTVLVRTIVSQALTSLSLQQSSQPRLGARIEEMINRHSAHYAALLRRGDIAPVQANQQLVRAAQGRLSHIPGASSLYATVIGRMLPHEQMLSLPHLLGLARTEHLAASEGISSLFTQQGYDRVLAAELAKAARNPFAADWVSGGQDKTVAAPQGDRLQEELVAAYRDDYVRQWQSFLSAVSLNSTGDLERCAALLTHLSGGESELTRLLEVVGSQARLNTDAVASQALDRLGDAAAARLGTNAAAQIPRGSGGTRNGFRFFEGIERFVRSDPAVQGGMNRYRELLGRVSDAAAQSRDPLALITVFNAGSSDPLQGAWNDTRALLTMLGSEQGAALQRLLLAPLEQTGSVIGGQLAQSLNTLWEGEIVAPFERGCAGRFPFSARGEEAAFDDVMTFFRPATGTWWGLHERALKSYIVKSGTRWQARTNPLVNPSWNPAVFEAYAAAERISTALFAPNGEPRPLNVRVEQAGSAGVVSTLRVDGQEIIIRPGMKGGSFLWPAGSAGDGAVLSVEVSGGYTQEVRFGGRWGLLRLVRAADQIRRISPTTFTAEWRMNIQNMYMVPVVLRFSVSTSGHPLGEPLFEQFGCPPALVLAQRSR